MRLADLLDRLPEDSVQRVSLSDPDCDVYNVSFMTPEALEHPRGDVLYFTDSELLPTSISDDQHFNCVVVDGGQAPEDLDEGPTVNLVWLAMGVDLFAFVRRNWLPVSDSGKPRSVDSPKRLGRRHELAMCNVMLRLHIVRLAIL